jgi:hypothetical protein
MAKQRQALASGTPAREERKEPELKREPTSAEMQRVRPLFVECFVMPTLLLLQEGAALQARLKALTEERKEKRTLFARAKAQVLSQVKKVCVQSRKAFSRFPAS